MTSPRYPSIIGLTGGIASGKSTVAKRWRKRGASIIDADQVARDVVRKGELAHGAICAEFGDEILGTDGELDRPKLGRIVFANPERLDALNAIVHPAMMSQITHLVQHYLDEGIPWVIYEAALIIEKRLSPTLSEVISVIAEPDTQLRRLMARNSLSELEARNRMSAQTDNATRHAVSDYVINNEGSVTELYQLADQHFERLVKTYGQL